MSSLHKLLLALLLAAFAWVVAPADAVAQSNSLAVVDLQRALQEVKDGASANARLKSAFDEKKNAIAQMEQKLMTMQQEYEKQSLILSDEARRQKESEMMQAQMAYQQTYQQYQLDMQELEANLVGELLEKMQGIVEQIAKEKGYSVVFEASSLVYSGGATDITNDLIKRYDTTHGG